MESLKTNENATVKINTWSDKIKRFFQKLEEGCDNIIKKAPAFIMKVGMIIGRLVRDCISLAASLSIIAIAVIMTYTFIETHPTEWANFVSALQNMLGTVKNAALWPFEMMRNTITSFLG